MTRHHLRGERPRRPSAARAHPLEGLRPAPSWQPPWRSGPVDPAWDPCGAPPIQAPALTLTEDVRAAAIITAVTLLAGRGT